jgi:hypothetical protein
MPFLDPAPDSPAPTETAVIVPVRAVEPVVQQHRRSLDPPAEWGIPAHVTALYPFVQQGAVDEQVAARLRTAIQPTRAFSCQFARTQWFREDVLWLDPDPADPFRRLTAAVWDAFPAYPPFGGAYDDVIPHLTIANRPTDGVLAMQAVESVIQPQLPVNAFIDRVLLIAGAQTPDSWRVLYEIPLNS